MSRASTKAMGHAKTATAYGSTSEATPVLPILSRTKRNIPGSRSAPEARTCPSAPTMVTRPVSSACGCFPIPISTRPPPSAGIPNAITPIPPTTTTKSSSSLIGSACPAVSVTWGRTRATRPPTRNTPSGRISTRIQAPNISGSIASSCGTWTNRALHISCSTPLAPARSIPRLFPPIT